jgi:menaquinol-cytochrome c reductase iron-sulfur subunit
MAPRAIETNIDVIAGETVTGRRRFLSGTIYTLATAIAGTLGATSARYLLQAPEADDESQWSPVGDISQFRPGVPQKVMFTRTRMDGWKRATETDTAWIVRDADGELTAFAPQCTHLGCPYHWETKRHAFVCPCHGSIFSQTGNVISGPANRPLDRYEVRLERSNLTVGPLIKIGGA